MWSNLWVAMFVMEVRSFCLFLPPISPISLMSSLSLTHSTFFYHSLPLFLFLSLSLSLALYNVQWRSVLACGSRVDLPARTACTVCCHIDVAFFFFFARTAAEITKCSVSAPAPHSLLTQPRSAVNHKRRWLPCSLIESTFPFSSDTARSDEKEAGEERGREKGKVSLL